MNKLIDNIFSDILVKGIYAVITKIDQLLTCERCRYISSRHCT